MYSQIIQPNLSTVGNVGWCLQFVENAYGTDHIGATATDAWNATRHPHKGNPPTDVKVPVWYSYWEGGVNYGHVAINVPGKGVLSSPYAKDGTQQWFSSIEQCRKVMGCKEYLGWSEDLAGAQLIRKEAEMPTEQEVKNRFALIGLTPTPAQIKLYTGRSFDELGTNLLKQSAVMNAELKKKLANGAVTKDSVLKYVQTNLK
jgi:hypothetical protein